MKNCVVSCKLQVTLNCLRIRRLFCIDTKEYLNCAFLPGNYQITDHVNISYCQILSTYSDTS